MKELIKLWNHQRETAARAAEVPDYALFFEQGTGKSATAITILRSKCYRKKRLLRTLVLCPPVVRRAWQREFKAHSTIKDHLVMVLDGKGRERTCLFRERAFTDGRPAPGIFITNYESLSMEELFHLMKDWGPEMLILDECFAAGTLVDTPEGRIPIESVRKGDFILNAFGACRVRDTFTRKIEKKVAVQFGGETVVCSFNHPWFTTRGWVSARDLRKGDRLVRLYTGMRLVRGRLLGEEQGASSVLQHGVCREGESPEYRDKRKNKQSTHEESGKDVRVVQGSVYSDSFCCKEAEVLRALLLGEMADEPPGVCEVPPYSGKSGEDVKGPKRKEVSGNVGTSKKTESYVQPKDKEEVVKDSEENGVGATGKRWQWTGAYRAGKTAVGKVRQLLGVESCNKPGEKTTWLSNLLQSRPGKAGHKAGSGSRRVLPLFKESSGSEERQKTWTVGVGSVTFFKQRYQGKSYSDTFYDLAVDKHPSFSVNGILVHNSHKVKDIKARRTKLCIELADRTPNKLILTGTPILNTAMDIWAQFRILDGGATFDRNFYAFRARYFVDRNAGMPKQKYFPDWRPAPGLAGVFNDLIYRKAARVLKKDCLDLPPIVRQRIEVELSGEQARMYKAMKRDYVAYLGGKACVASIALTKGLRLQQMVSGFWVDEESDKPHAFKNNPRLKAVAELLADITPTAKVIIWASFRHSYRELAGVCDGLGVKAVSLYGGMTDKARQEAIDDFQTDDGTRVMIANPAAGGVGVTLTAASYMVYYSRSFSLEHDLQSEARCHRGGSQRHEKITRIDMVAPETIDEVILDALERKENLASSIVNIRDRL